MFTANTFQAQTVWPLRIVGVILTPPTEDINTPVSAMFGMKVIRERIPHGEPSFLAIENHVVGYVTGLGNIRGLVDPFGPEIVTPLFVNESDSLTLSGRDLDTTAFRLGMMAPALLGAVAAPVFVVNGGRTPQCLQRSHERPFIWYLRGNFIVTDIAQWSPFSPPYTMSGTTSIIEKKRSRSNSISFSMDSRKHPKISPGLTLRGDLKLQPPDPVVWSHHFNFGDLGSHAESSRTTYHQDSENDARRGEAGFGWDQSVIATVPTIDQASVGRESGAEYVDEGFDLGYFDGEGLDLDSNGDASDFHDGVGKATYGGGAAHGGVGYGEGAGHGGAGYGEGVGDGGAGYAGAGYAGAGYAGAGHGEGADVGGAGYAGAGYAGAGGGGAGYAAAGYAGAGHGEGAGDGGEGYAGAGYAGTGGGGAGYAAAGYAGAGHGEGAGDGGEGYATAGYAGAGHGEGAGDEGAGYAGAGHGGAGYVGAGNGGAGYDGAVHGGAGYGGAGDEGASDEGAFGDNMAAGVGDGGVVGTTATDGEPGPAAPAQPLRADLPMDPTQVALYVVLIYRLRLVQRGTDLSKYIVGIVGARLVAEELYPIALGEMFLDIDLYVSYKAEIIQEAAIAMRDRINGMMGIAVDIVYGPTTCGGYGIDHTPDGKRRAAALIAGDAYLYSTDAKLEDPSIRYGHPGLRISSHKIAYGGIGPAAHPDSSNNEDLMTIFDPTLRSKMPKTTINLSRDLILRRLYIAAGQASVGKQRSNERWALFDADYDLHEAALEKIKVKWLGE